MAINIIEDICPVSELKKNPSSLIQQVHRTHRPVVLTVNGKAEAVLIDAGDYNRREEELELLKKLLVAEKDVAEGRVYPAEEVYEELINELIA